MRSRGILESLCHHAMQLLGDHDLRAWVMVFLTPLVFAAALAGDLFLLAHRFPSLIGLSRLRIDVVFFGATISGPALGLVTSFLTPAVVVAVLVAIWSPPPVGPHRSRFTRAIACLLWFGVLPLFYLIGDWIFFALSRWLPVSVLEMAVRFGVGIDLSVMGHRLVTAEGHLLSLVALLGGVALYLGAGVYRETR
ncbi:MAG: hypothetical protein SVU69_00580 [Pseudomonadota bacterium]|nr:hypothetical protein [Pseudomonadota bacterium]